MKLILIFTSIIISFLYTNIVNASQCMSDIGTFNQVNENYYQNKSNGALAVKCMAFAGDDRAATLYAEHLLEQFNNNGDKSYVIEAYAWYRLSIERAKRVADWMQMVQVLESEFPRIKSDSEGVFSKIKQQVLPRQRFDSKIKIVFKKHEQKVDHRRTYVGSRIPIDRRKYTTGNVRIATSGSLDSGGGVSAGGAYKLTPLAELESEEDTSNQDKKNNELPRKNDK